MDRTQSQKWLTWSIVVLVALNIVSISALWLVRCEQGKPLSARQGNQRLEDIIVSGVGLDKEQETRFRELHARHRAVKDSLENEVFQLKTQIQNELFSPVPDTVKLAAMSAKIGDLQAEFEKQVLLHTLDIKALCRPEQYPQLKTLLDNMLNATQRHSARGPDKQRKKEYKPEDESRPPPR